MSAELVSVHGGHSGEFCCHADDTLAEIVAEYERQGFAWVGITEHMPPVSDEFLFPDEIEAGFDAESMAERFARYIVRARELQKEYRGRLEIFVGFETEMYTGALDYAERLIELYEPDYVVGSVHHVNDQVIDGTAEQYAHAAEVAGGLDELYFAYFDHQLEVIERLRPAVVGHLDLVRMHDPDYRERMQKPEIWRRVERNLESVERNGLILDYNVRALAKGALEPYVTRSILELSAKRLLPVVPGDDSHRIGDVGAHVEEGIRILESVGCETNWQRPAAEWG